jgi:hypothetical protein
VGGVQHHDLPAAPARFVFESLHQQLADPAAPETLPDDEPRDLAARLVALDEVLDVQRGESGELRLELGHDDPGEWVGGDPPDAFSRLRGRRRVAELTEQRSYCGSVASSRFSNR